MKRLLPLICALLLASVLPVCWTSPAWAQDCPYATGSCEKVCDNIPKEAKTGLANGWKYSQIDFSPSITSTEGQKNTWSIFYDLPDFTCPGSYSEILVPVKVGSFDTWAPIVHTNDHAAGVLNLPLNLDPTNYPGTSDGFRLKIEPDCNSTCMTDCTNHIEWTASAKYYQCPIDTILPSCTVDLATLTDRHAVVNLQDSSSGLLRYQVNVEAKPNYAVQPWSLSDDEVGLTQAKAVTIDYTGSARTAFAAESINVWDQAGNTSVCWIELPPPAPPLAAGTALWGALPSNGAQDWRAVTVPDAGGKLLVAVHTRGQTEVDGKDLDLDVWSSNGLAEGTGEVASSAHHGNVSWVGANLPMKGDERVLLNANPAMKYFVHVFEAAESGQTSGNPPWLFHEIVSGSKINSSFNPKPAITSEPYADKDPRAPGGVYSFTATFTNTSMSDWQDLTFDVDLARTTPGVVLLNQDTTGAPGVVSLSVPNQELCENGVSSYLCRLDHDDNVGFTTFKVRFELGLPAQLKKVYFYVDLYGNRVGGSSVSSTNDAPGSSDDSFVFQVPDVQGQPLQQANLIYLPAIAK